MGNEATRPALLALRDAIRQRIGLVYADDAALTVLARKLDGFVDAADPRALECLGAAVQRGDPKVIDAVAERLVVKDTWFFRGTAQMEALTKLVIPTLRARAAAEPLTLWSAGCATGEEPYSLALLFRHHAFDLCARRVRIVATDISAIALATARAARYGPASFLRTTPRWRRQYLGVARASAANASTMTVTVTLTESVTETEAEPTLGVDMSDAAAVAAVTVDEQARRLVMFHRHNLLDPQLPLGLLGGHVDLIVCRNVSMYFDEATRRDLFARFAAALRPGGFLLVGESETVPSRDDWELVESPGAFLYRKPSPASLWSPAGDPRTSLAHGETCDPSAASTAAAWPPPTSPGDANRPIESTTPAEASTMSSPDAPRCPTAGPDTVPSIAAAPLRAEEFVLAAIANEDAGDDEAAVAAYRKALFLDKGLVVAHLFVAAVYERQQRQADAERHYETVRRLVAALPDSTPIPLAEGLNAGFVREYAAQRLAMLAAALP